MILGYLLFEVPDSSQRQPPRVFCGRPWLSSGTVLERSYNIDDVLIWCADNHCDVEDHNGLFVIHPIDDNADFAFKLRWQ